ncbi:PilZ domain-containing protein [Pseudomaricurvus alkylphenolicus]|jgi:c-di-GMP-binding flagellar brake protein YcgR|uniref:PilZ domain-containing protein n=1 Tax=Pseudomaricurvus alkylphenolicus TaxID=1306991 RepID=UPI00142416E1|nr:PilZ domain-containing protein [Pseudomaricurvus alkylphenolicus]NIB43163.1 PilZ domain-containing protein [Pseudomaricurvus alkylphenolicus]
MSTADRDYSEKRNFLRMQIDTPVSIYIQSDGEDLTGMCRDLSGGGLQVELNKALPLGSEVEVTISSGHGHSPMLQAKAKVMRVDAGPGEKSTMGMEIVEVND